MTALLQVEGLGKRFGGFVALDGIQLEVKDWEKHGYELPLLVNLQPAGEYLGEDYHRAGGVPAVAAQPRPACTTSTRPMAPSSAARSRPPRPKRSVMPTPQTRRAQTVLLRKSERGGFKSA